jgi:hypothetical protein
MDTNSVLQAFSIVIECIVALAGVRLATRGKKFYGWWIALTFALYVVFDLGRLKVLSLGEGTSAVLFFLASCSALYAVWLLGNEVIRARRVNL